MFVCLLVCLFVAGVVVCGGGVFVAVGCWFLVVGCRCIVFGGLLLMLMFVCCC